MNIKKNKTIGIRTDEHFIKLLETASEIYNTSKSWLPLKTAQATKTRRQAG